MRKFFLVVISSHFAFLTLAQSDTSFMQAASAKMITYYDQIIQEQNGLYTGAEYKEPETTQIEYPFYVKGNPLVESEDFWNEGDIIFNNELYRNVPIQYDITSDMVITENWMSDDIMLIKDKVSYFSVGEDKFIHVKNAAALNLPRDGFYQAMYDGRSTVLAKHIKSRQERLDQRKFVVYYIYRTRYYLKKNNLYYPIAKKSELLKLLEDQKPAIKAYLREQKIKVSKRYPDSFAKVAAYYDSLTPAK